MDKEVVCHESMDMEEKGVHVDDVLDFHLLVFNATTLAKILNLIHRLHFSLDSTPFLIARSCRRGDPNRMKNHLRTYC